MSKFIGYTVGLNCEVGGQIKMVKIEYSDAGDSMKLQAVSGNNLAKIPGHSAVISRAEFEDRPADPYDAPAQAIWALKLVGLRP